MVRTRSPRWLLAATTLAYLLIALVIIGMISPFALSLYAAYGPVLNFLTVFQLIRWSSEFFLAHLLFLEAPLILSLSSLQASLLIGLAFFLSAAIPLYWGRFTKKGVAQIVQPAAYKSLWLKLPCSFWCTRREDLSPVIRLDQTQMASMEKMNGNHLT